MRFSRSFFFRCVIRHDGMAIVTIDVSCQGRAAVRIQSLSFRALWWAPSSIRRKTIKRYRLPTAHALRLKEIMKSIHLFLEAHRIVILYKATGPFSPHSGQYRSRNFFFSIFPDPVLGSAGIKSIDFGDLYLAIRSLQKAISSSSVALHAGFRTTIPLTASPHFSSGTPTTAHSRTAGCR